MTAGKELSIFTRAAVAGSEAARMARPIDATAVPKIGREIPRAFYVATRSLARAMQRGEDCQKGTIYGVFDDAAKAAAFVEDRKLGLSTSTVYL